MQSIILEKKQTDFYKALAPGFVWGPIVRTKPITGRALVEIDTTVVSRAKPSFVGRVEFHDINGR